MRALFELEILSMREYFGQPTGKPLYVCLDWCRIFLLRGRLAQKSSSISELRMFVIVSVQMKFDSDVYSAA